MKKIIKNKKILTGLVLFLIIIFSIFLISTRKSEKDVLAASDCVSGGGVTCTATTVGSYIVNTYTGTGTTSWTPPSGVTSVEYLVVGAGAGGGWSSSTGGGGGGSVLSGTLSVSGSQTVTVGAGGTYASYAGTNGGSSIFSSITAPGGSAATSAAGGTSGNGRAGGSHDIYGSTYYRDGGGGGAGAVGGDASTGAVSGYGGNGGDGISSSITGGVVMYGGGGGGSGWARNGVHPIGGTGGSGGGGNAGTYSNAGSNGTANTGGGGGGGGGGGAGGSGVVIIKYLPDTTAPTIAQVTAVPSPTGDSTPNYTFSSTEAGTITYGGDCSSATTSAVSGNNTITFNTLSSATHSNCTIRVTDGAGNPSSYLSVNTFTVDTTGPTIAQVTAVITPTSDTTPDYTFSSTEAGTITYGGDCSSATTAATVGSNTITFNTLSVAAHSNCTITVTDSLNNQSNVLTVNTFTVIISTATITSTAISTTDDDICKTESGSIVCRSGQPITFSSVGTGTSQVKLYICKDYNCTNCGTSSTSNCWAYSTSYASSNPSAVYDSSCYLGSCGTGECEYGLNNYWAKVCSSDACSDIIDSRGNYACGNNVTFTYNGSSATYGTVSTSTGECWLDRNLGATQVATAYNDSAAYGHLFQWGRLVDGHQLRTSGTTTTLSSSDAPGHANFIYGMGSPYDWRSSRNDSLWQGVSGINNPCPTGWRLPTSTEWQAEITAGSWTNYNNTYASPLKLTAAGYRFGVDASLYSVGSSGVYWSSSISDISATSFIFNSGGAVTSVYIRATGFSARCIKD